MLIAKQIFITLMLVSLSVSTALGQESTEHVAVFVTGARNGSNFTVPFGTNTVSGLNIAKTIQPGVEVVFKPRGRFSFGAGFSKLDFAEKKDHITIFKDEFFYFGPNGVPVIISMPGTEFAYVDATTSAKTDVFTGMAYLNFSKEGKVRPFIGGGGGVGLTKTEWRNKAYFHPLFQQFRPDFKFLAPDYSTGRSKLGVLKIVGGMNVSPMKHVVIRTVAGYLNGGYGAVGIGFGF